MIEVQGLTKYYADLRRGRFVALDGLSFHARPGQIYGLLGPNGAGKTTALRILSTVLRPSSGTARVNGFDVVLQPSQVRRQIGFMSANTAVYDRMTAWEMVEYFGRLHGLPPAELTERMESLFEKFKMNDIRDLLGAKMSTGMRQKVSIARAIVHDPPVLIFDEATAGLDVLVARALLNRVAELRRQRQVHHLLHPHHARGRETLRSPGDHAPRPHPGRGHAGATSPGAWRERPGRDLLPTDFPARTRAGAGRRARPGLIGRPCISRTSDSFSPAKSATSCATGGRLFMIFVLPILLYPLLGTACFQMIQFQTQNTMTVLVVGGGQLASAPTPLIDAAGFCAATVRERVRRRQIAEAGDGVRGAAFQ